MNKKIPNAGRKKIDLEKELLINNFFSNKVSCRPKKKNSRTFILGFLLVTILALGAGIISMLAATTATIPISLTIPEPVVPVFSPITVSLTADVNPIDSGASANINWTVGGSVSSCDATGDWTGTKSASGGTESTGNLISAKTYTLTCSGPGGSASATLTINVNPASVATVDLITNKTSVGAGGSATLTWTSSNAAACSASTTFGAADWSGAKATNDTVSGVAVTLPMAPGAYRYTLTCDGVSDYVDISAGLPPIVDLASDKTSVGSGEEAALTWTSANADACTASTTFGASDWAGSANLNDSKNIILPLTDGSYDYRLTCTNVFGSTTSMVSIDVATIPTPVVTPVIPPVCGDGICETDKGEDASNCPADCALAPDVTLASSATNVGPGDAFKLTWTSNGATSCEASNSSDTPDWNSLLNPSLSPMALNGTIPGFEATAPSTPGSYDYTITCTGEAGKKSSAKVTVNVPASGGGGGEVTKQTTQIFVGPNEGDPEVIIIVTNPIVNPPYVTPNIAWSAPKAKVCIASGQEGWSGTKQTVGDEDIKVPQVAGEYTYVLICDKTVAYAKIKVLEGRLRNVGAVAPPAKSTSATTRLIQYISSFFSNNQNLWWLLLLLIPVLLLIYLLTRKRSVVYNSATHKPIEGVKLELYEAKKKAVVQTVLSDGKGHFLFRRSKLKKGYYYITASRRGYIFPSKKLKAKTSAKNLYFGSTFRIGKGQAIRARVPMDPAETKTETKRKR